MVYKVVSVLPAPAGPAGPDGPKGSVGPTGPLGNKGNVGSKGSQGQAFQVDEFNVLLSDAKVNDIILNQSANANDFYLFVVGIDSRSSSS